MSRQTLTVRDGIPPGGKRFGLFDQSIEQKRHQHLGKHPYAEGLIGSGRYVVEVQERLEGLELHLDLPAETVQIEHAFSREF